MSETKYCEDCKWCIPYERMTHAQCSNPELRQMSGHAFVSRALDKPPYAAECRIGSKCGPEAKLFEAKEAG